MVTELRAELAWRLGLLGEAGKASRSVTVSGPETAAPSLTTVTEALADVWPEAVLMRQVYRPGSRCLLSKIGDKISEISTTEFTQKAPGRNVYWVDILAVFYVDIINGLCE